MKERGMIFNGEMVRALLDGRKTQTRRPVNPQPELTAGSGFSWKGWVYGSGSSDRETNKNFAHVTCPYGKPGDRIWVRETWQAIHDSVDEFGHVEERTYAPSIPKEKDRYWHAVYAEHFGVESREDRGFPWRPAIHMPRWASRILLDITDVRVERVQSISQADAIAEGAPPSHPSIDSVSRDYGYPDFSRSWYGQTWQSIYGEENWQANPWVWVIEFKKIDGGDHATNQPQ